MKRLATLASVLITLTAFGQLPSRVLTTPITPSREALDRLNLHLDWRLQLPVESKRDGIANIQHLGQDLFVQLRDGLILCVDAETGTVRWTKRIGNRYPVARKIGYGNDLVFLLDGHRIIALERATGTQRWDLELPELPLAPPMAGDLFMYVPFANGRVQTYALPDTISRVQKLDSVQKDKARQVIIDTRAKLRATDPSATTGAVARPAIVDPTSGRAMTSIGLETRKSTSMGETTVNRGELRRIAQVGAEVPDRPTLVISNSPGFRATYPINVNDVGVLITGPGRDALLLRRDPENPVFRFTTDAPMSMPPVDYGTIAYLTSGDSTVQSVDLAAGLINWRFSAGSPIIELPVATEDSVFLQTASRGLIRVDRRTGVAVWIQPEATQFQAVNTKFVYVTDRFGQLLVLDRATGTILSRYDSSDYNIVFPNHQTDRLILASNDGSLLSLHDNGQSRPLEHRPMQGKPRLPATNGKAGEKAAETKAGNSIPK